MSLLCNLPGLPKAVNGRGWVGCLYVTYNLIRTYEVEKFRIRETKNLSTDADSSTDTTVGWTKNTQKPIFFLTEKIIQNGKTQKRLEICQN